MATANSAGFKTQPFPATHDTQVDYCLRVLYVCIYMYALIHTTYLSMVWGFTESLTLPIIHSQTHTHRHCTHMRIMYTHMYLISYRKIASNTSDTSVCIIT